MPHQVGEQGDVVILFKKILGVAVAERMWIHDLRVKPVFLGIIFQLLRDPARGDALAVSVEKQIAGGAVRFLQPFNSFKP